MKPGHLARGAGLSCLCIDGYRHLSCPFFVDRCRARRERKRPGQALVSSGPIGRQLLNNDCVIAVSTTFKGRPWFERRRVIGRSRFGFKRDLAEGGKKTGLVFQAQRRYQILPSPCSCPKSRRCSYAGTGLDPSLRISRLLRRSSVGYFRSRTRTAPASRRTPKGRISISHS